MELISLGIQHPIILIINITLEFGMGEPDDLGFVGVQIACGEAEDGQFIPLFIIRWADTDNDLDIATGWGRAWWPRDMGHVVVGGGGGGEGLGLVGLWSVG